MKTFKQLTVLDTLYRVYTDYRSKERPYFEKITIHRLEIEEVDKKKCLVINKRGNSYGDFRGHIFDLEDCETNYIETKDGMYVTEYPLLVKCLRDAGLKHIRDIESKINENKKEIEKIRSAYYEYLNNLITEPLAP